MPALVGGLTVVGATDAATVGVGPRVVPARPPALGACVVTVRAGSPLGPTVALSLLGVDSDSAVAGPTAAPALVVTLRREVPERAGTSVISRAATTITA